MFRIHPQDLSVSGEVSALRMLPWGQSVAGVPRALQDAELHPWPLPTRCLWFPLPHRSDSKTCLPMLLDIPWRANHF